MTKIKLVIPITVALVRNDQNKSQQTSSMQHLWIKSFPCCFHEREDIVESWQALEIHLLVIASMNNQIVTASHCSNPKITEQLTIKNEAIFSVLDKEEPEEVAYEYVAQKHREYVWLMVYCRKCLSLFQACGLSI